jgi:[ribosomal protein S5]-alanine N-acetyltransferase
MSSVDAKKLFAFEMDNKEFFEMFVPPRPESYFNFVGQQFTGKGAAVKGLQCLISEARDMGLKEKHAKTTKNNTASQKVLKRCLFQEELEDKDNFINYKLTL